MTTELTTTAGGAVIVASQGRLDQNPAAVYLAGLSAGSRRTMRQTLDVIAGLVSGGTVGAFGLDWAALRFQHTAAIRSRLAETYSAATVNKALSALRGVLKAAWRLGQMDAEAFQNHVRNCPVCLETMKLEKRLTDATSTLRQEAHSPWLWQRIEASLEEEKAKSVRSPSWAWMPAFSAAAILIVAVVLLLLPKHADEDLLADSALKKVERTEVAYANAIEKMEEAAIPKLASLDLELMLLYREKLETIELQISECREALMENPGNSHIRRYMLAALQDKKNTLKEILQIPKQKNEES